MAYLFSGTEIVIDGSNFLHLLATPSPGDSSLKAATTAYVDSAVSVGGTYSPGAVAITGGTINGTTLGATTAAAIKGAPATSPAC